MEMPVYLFTGFLEAGKTKFIQETLADPKFNEGEQMLVLLCEEGEEELDLSAMPGGGKNISVSVFDDEQRLTPDRLSALQKRARAERVLIEYNGMWNIDTLYNSLPDGWFVCEEICLFDASTIQQYNANMRQLVVDKLKSAQMVIYNRVRKDMDIEFMHKLVRAVSRRCNIGYEYEDGTFIPDEIEDPLPFDLNAPVVEISDKDYAIWYSHISENMEQYDGKTVSFLGLVERDPSMGKNLLAIGRQVMVCCAADTAYRPLIAKYEQAGKLNNGQWVRATGKITLENNRYYQTKGPVLNVTALVPASEPADPVAAFY